MPNYSPKNAAMMESGKQPPMGLADLMSEDFQNRDRSGGYDQMVSAQQDTPGAEGKSMYPQFQQGSTTGNQIKQLREMVQGQRQGGGMMGQQYMQQPSQQPADMQQPPQQAGPDDVYRAIMGG